MEFLRKLLALFTLVAVVGSGSLAQAADNSGQATKKEAAKDLVLKGDAKCTECHDEADAPEKLAIGKTRHGTVADGRTPSCTSCHGESDAHVKNPQGGKTRPPVEVAYKGKFTSSPQAQTAACLTCHQGGNRIFWQSSTHAGRDVTCTSCHEIHTAHDAVRDKAKQTETCFTCHKEQRAQMAKPSHHPVPEGKMACSSCHNVHGSNPKQLARASTNETCYTCHMEKRGPFVHNHQPVSEDCGICHNPHGSTIANLLKARAPFLCQDCHASGGHPQQIAGLPDKRGTASTPGTVVMGSVGRGCVNCHTNIHGSNSTVNSATAERFRR
ncbi:MAG: DmsE family decaheme c-type cytochrome [Rhodocyclaceae bacterium]|nr:DmsE family decaheme c-type cytochrome [Rhodocyclaceae bacterium]